MRSIDSFPKASDAQLKAMMNNKETIEFPPHRQPSFDIPAPQEAAQRPQEEYAQEPQEQYDNTDNYQENADVRETEETIQSSTPEVSPTQTDNLSASETNWRLIRKKAQAVYKSSDPIVYPIR